jgi:hypothetical protein
MNLLRLKFLTGSNTERERERERERVRVMKWDGDCVMEVYDGARGAAVVWVFVG